MRPDQEVEPHLADHLHSLRKDNQRPRSIRERRLSVLRVARRLGHPVAEVSESDLTAWQDARVDELKPTAMKNELVHVSMYLRWLHEQHRRDDDPSRVLVRPKHVNQRLPQPTADADIARALTATDVAGDAEMRVWLELGAFCGLRCMEIAAMRREWILTGPPRLRVIGKGNKERVVPLPPSLLVKLQAGPFNPTGHLFNRIDGKPGPPSAMRVSERINDHLHALGIQSTAHKLRHRYGTEMYRLTKDPFRVAAYMGHASTDTTRGYVQLASDDSSDVAVAITVVA